MKLLLYNILLLLAIFIQCDEDYYKILGVEKDADDRTIRKAFKKLAIQKHPDKNTGNPDAHAEFVTINKAYEVLKDEELRKKYDQYGEKGLEDGFQGGNNYQSWQFYNDNFGIYDDDQEIVTLNRADFTRLVSETTDIWFINFYSTYCSHCHELAPTWRKFAREVEGAIRVGAVNCAEDPMLCQSQRVGGYPSLVFYPTGEFYQGQREVDALVDYIMQRLPSEVLHLKSDNVEALSESWDPYRERPWVVDFCDEMENCLSSINRRKLSAMLSGLVNVGTVDCTRAAEKELCETLRRTDGVVYYPPRQIDASDAKILNSMDPKEIAEEVLQYLDSFEEIDRDEIMAIFERGSETALAVWFVPNEDTVDKVLEMRRISSVLPDVRFRFADCSKMDALCGEHLDKSKLPHFVVFKPSGGYEIDYVNKGGYREAITFVRESMVSPLRALDDVAYSDATQSGELWIIDFFAPWCPPCMRLMGEYRRLHTQFEDGDELSRVKIGSVDCQKYKVICQNAGVSSYPTSFFYTEDGKTHTMVGFHNVEGIMNFLDDALHPSVEELSPDTFHQLVGRREDDVTWIVDYFAPWCGPCQQLAPELQRAARALKEHDGNVKVGSIDCQMYGDFCKQQQVTAYPTVRLYPSKTHKRRRNQHYDYPNNMWRNSDSIQRWVYGMLPSLVDNLGNDYWTQVLDSDEPWMVDFFAPWCGHCIQFSPTYEQLAKELNGKIKLAKVDCDQWPGVCQGAQVQAYPTIRLYPGRKNTVRQHVGGIPIRAHDKNTIINMLRQQLPHLFVEHDEL